MKNLLAALIISVFCFGCSESDFSDNRINDTMPEDTLSNDLGPEELADSFIADDTKPDEESNDIYHDIILTDERNQDTEDTTDNSLTDSYLTDSFTDDTGTDTDIIDDISDNSTRTPYVKITEPQNGSIVKNPVTFRFAAENVSSVRFFADGYPLGSAFDPSVKDSLTYTFTGVGYERNILLEGYNMNGQTVASDSIKITVVNDNDKGDLIGTMWNTYYYLVYEKDYTGADDTTLYDSNCKPIADVPYKFSDAVCIEGSGKLSDGRVINYAKTCSCGRKCAGYNYIVCYSVLDINKYPWGMGSKGNPLAVSYTHL
ncbi:MAG: hypothetical protein N3B13_11300, partial [Deltaproteobacteria bacterium]|nr:hypothetical protein [Deltaproteobacteria bacterium]